MAHTDYTARGLALPFCPTARLALPIGALDTTATMDGYTSPIGDGIRVGMAAMIEGEIVVVEARSGNTLTLGRGTCDTIPAPHPANAVIFFFDDSLGSDDRQYVATESIGVKPLPRTNSGGPLARESAPPEGLTFNWRFHRPYPPGDVTINGQPFTTTGALGPATGPLTLAWAHRDRIVQMDQLIKHGAPSIGPEPGTTYRILVIRTSDGSVRRSVDLGAVVAWTYTFAQMVADFGPSLVDIPAYITLESRRDGLSSWQSYRINFFAQASILAGSRTLDLGYEVLAAPPGPAPVAAFWAMQSGAPDYTLYNAFTSNGGGFPLRPGTNAVTGYSQGYPAAATMQRNFRVGLNAKVAMSIGAAETFEALTGNGNYTDVSTGVGVTTSGLVFATPDESTTDGFGRYSVSWVSTASGSPPRGNAAWIPNLGAGGTKALYTAAPSASTISLQIDFSRPVVAFGAYVIDFGDFGALVDYEFYRNGVLLSTKPHSPTISGSGLQGSVAFIGHIADVAEALFDRVIVRSAAAGSDGTDITAYDNFFVGIVEQITAVRATAGQSIQFTDTSTNAPTSWLWDFGDGTTSALQNPSKAYATAGTRTVTLTATNANGSDTVTKTGYVVVT